MYIADSASLLNMLDSWDTQARTLNAVETQLATGLANPNPGTAPSTQAIITEMGGQLGVLTAELQNTQSTITTLQTISGAYQNVGSVLDQLQQLAIQASQPNSTSDSTVLNNQVTSLLQQLTALTQDVTLNGRRVFAPAFTETRMGSTAPTISSITLDHYDQAGMAWAADQGPLEPMENILLRMQIQGSGFPQPSVMAPYHETGYVRVPQYQLIDESAPQFVGVYGGASFLTQAFTQSWTSTIIQTQGFGGGYGYYPGPMTSDQPYLVMYAGQPLKLVIYNEPLTASTTVTFTLPPIRPSGTSETLPNTAWEPTSGPTWTITAAHSTALSLGPTTVTLPFDTTMNPLSLQTLTHFAAVWNGASTGTPPGITASVAHALSAVVTSDLGTLGGWEATVGSVINQATFMAQSLETSQTQLTASQAVLQNVSLGTATAQLAKSQWLAQTSLQTLVATEQLPKTVMVLLRAPPNTS